MFTTSTNKYKQSFEKYVQCMAQYDTSNLDLSYKTAKKICIIHATRVPKEKPKSAVNVYRV